MLGELLTSAAEAQPDKPAVIVSSRSVSYRKLDAQAHALALALQRLGLRPGDRVAFQLPNGVEAAICYFACFKAGLIGVPCNTRLTAHETVFVLERSQACAYVGCRELSDFLSGRLAEWKMPASISIVPDLPLGPTGKIQRRLLRERMSAAAAALTR